jgi:hypothetical protein
VPDLLCMFMPPNSEFEFCCCGWACCVDPNSDGVDDWFCCAELVFPNKEGVVVCCVDEPLGDAVSRCVTANGRPYLQQRGLCLAAEESSRLCSVLVLVLVLRVPSQCTAKEASALLWLWLRLLRRRRAEQSPTRRRRSRGLVHVAEHAA